MKIALFVFAVLFTTVNAFAESPFLGTWKSDWGGDIGTTLVVKSVSGNKAVVKYSWDASAYGGAGSINLSAKVRGDKLSWKSSGIGFVFQDSGGTLHATRTTSQGSVSTIFRKAN